MNNFFKQKIVGWKLQEQNLACCCEEENVQLSRWILDFCTSCHAWPTMFQVQWFKNQRLLTKNPSFKVEIRPLRWCWMKKKHAVVLDQNWFESGGNHHCLFSLFSNFHRSSSKRKESKQKQKNNERKSTGRKLFISNLMEKIEPAVLIFS